MTAETVKDRLIALFPEFSSFWESNDNYFTGEGKAFTACALLAEFSHFFRDRHPTFNESQLAALFTFIEELMTSGEEAVRTAAATCFLENLAGEVVRAL
jgi:hypothetical protein